MILITGAAGFIGFHKDIKIDDYDYILKLVEHDVFESLNTMQVQKEVLV